MFNARMKLSCWLVGIAIKTLPADWQTSTAIRNLILVKAINTSDEGLINDK